MAEAVTGAGTLGEFFERIHAIVAGLMEARNCFVALADGERGGISYPYFVDETEPPPGPQPAGKTLTDYVLGTGRPLLATPEVFRELVRTGEVVLAGADSVDWLGVPLLASGRVIGVLAVQSYSGDTRYTEEDLELLRFVGTHAGLAIERWRAEQSVRESATRNAALLDAMPDLLFVIGRDGTYRVVHAPDPEGLAAPAEVLLRRRVQDMLPEEVSKPWLRAIERAIDCGGPQELDYALDVPAGRRLFEARIVPHGPDAALAIVRDVTARRGMEEELGRSKAELQRLADHMVDAVAEIDLKGKFLWASPSHRTIAGITPSELIGRTAYDWVHPDDAPRVREELAHPAVGGGTGLSEYRFRHGDGRWIWIESVANLLLDKAGEPRSIVIASRVVHGRKRAEIAVELLRETDRKILRQEPLAETLAFLCREIAARLEFELVWIGSPEAGGRLAVTAAAGSATDCLEGADLRWDESPGGRGVAGIAIRTGRPAILNDLLSSTDDVVKAKAAEWGLASVAACPLGAGEGAPAAVLLVASSRTRAFDVATIGLLSRFADQVALSIQAAEHLSRIELQTAALAATANAVVITREDGVVEWVNPAFTLLTGWEASEVVGRSLDEERTESPESSLVREQRRRTVGEGKVWRGELFSRRKDGSIYVEEETVTPVRGKDGRVGHVIAVKQDVTPRRRSEERIRHLALHDPLTDLPNRRALEENLVRVVDRSARGTRSTLILLDLDNFKIVNDSLGHPAGDRVLVDLGRLLVATVRPGDLVFRLGGDEFVVLLEAVSVDAGRVTAERIRHAVDSRRFILEERSFALSVSLGVVPIDGRLDGPAVLALADTALYSAKEKGKNRVVVFDSGALRLSQLSAASEWASRIKDALRLNRFSLHYQPIFRLGKARPVHWEALLRLVEESGLVIPPTRFLPAAERFGLMPQLDAWVVDAVLAVLGERPGVEIFVNLSGTSLGNEELLGEIEERIRRAGLGPRRLAFEITETTAVGDVLVAREWMRRLTELGCRFALDDFGIGFSSFAYLQGLPADYVKIDGSFIRDIERNDANQALVRAIATVAHTLGKETIAESVESLDALQVLGALGVDLVQGFALGRPGPEPPTS